MTTTVRLVRHARHGAVDAVLCGRMDGVGLDVTGNTQARGVAASLAGVRVDAVQSSPQQRAHETATPIAARLGLPVETAPALDELDYGDWTGKPFSTLAADEDWRSWNTQRSRHRPPNGESMQQLQTRMLAHLNATHEAYPDGDIVMVTHAEPIRAVVLHCHALGFDAFGSVAIEPASITTLAVNRSGMRLLSANAQVAA